jgi:3' terminal RNA ribose 2'-O-methyltransferase Hen1
MDVLTHLYVLIPVLDNNKHYYVGEAEVENLLTKGKNWLAQHPKKEVITRRYLKHKFSLARQALARLMDDNQPIGAGDSPERDSFEESLEKPLSLNEQRIKAVLSKIVDANAGSVIDMGCGEGKFLRDLIKAASIERIVGMDVSIRSLEIARKRIGLDRLPNRIKDKISLFHGSLMYKDQRFSGFDAAVVMEVIEHLDPPRLAAFERVLFEYARPMTVILTTPNRDYNSTWNILPKGALRHSDHRFEWTRAEFREWADRLAEKYDYSIAFYAIGPEDSALGSPTQMGVFKRAN